MNCDSCNGVCCTDIYTVFISSDDAKRLAKHVGMALEEFRTDYLIGHFLKKENCMCVFLKNGRCTVYAVRPEVCRSFTCSEKKRKLLGAYYNARQQRTKKAS